MPCHIKRRACIVGYHKHPRLPTGLLQGFNSRSLDVVAENIVQHCTNRYFKGSKYHKNCLAELLASTSHNFHWLGNNFCTPLMRTSSAVDRFCLMCMVLRCCRAMSEVRTFRSGADIDLTAVAGMPAKPLVCVDGQPVSPACTWLGYANYQRYDCFHFMPLISASPKIMASLEHQISNPES